MNRNTSQNGRSLSLKLLKDSAQILAQEYVDAIKEQSLFKINKKTEYVTTQIDKKFNDYTSFTYWMYHRSHPSLRRKRK
jgi:hypothetical protein